MAKEVPGTKEMPAVINECVCYCNSPIWISERVIFVGWFFFFEGQ